MSARYDVSSIALDAAAAFIAEKNIPAAERFVTRSTTLLRCSRETRIWATEGATSPCCRFFSTQHSTHDWAAPVQARSSRSNKFREAITFTKKDDRYGARDAALGLLTLGIVSVLGSGDSVAACVEGQIASGSRCIALNDAADGIRRLVEGAIERYDLNAVIVSVQVGDEPLITEAWGETLAGVPATPEMHFRNGAIAISYLTTLLLQLRDEGVVSIYDKLSNWFPYYPEAGRINLLMLANSTSGYADYEPVISIHEDVFRQWEPGELIAIGLARPMACDPGTCFSYAHTNYVILGEVLERVTGTRLDELMRERILEPLNLRER